MKIKPGKYKHYKGKLYEVTGEARHSETLEEFVVYRALHDSPEFGKNALWVRPKRLFADKVIYKGRKVPHFEKVNEK